MTQVYSEKNQIAPYQSNLGFDSHLGHFFFLLVSWLGHGASFLAGFNHVANHIAQGNSSFLKSKAPVSQLVNADDT